MSLANALRRFDAARWVRRVLIVQTTAVGLWTVATFVLSLAAGMWPSPALIPLALAVAGIWLTASWGRRAEWVGPVLVVIEVGVLFLCAFAWLVHGPVIGSVVFGGLSTALLVLLALPAGRARSAVLGRP